MNWQMLMCKESALKFKVAVQKPNRDLQIYETQDLVLSLSSNISFDIAIFYLEIKPQNGIQILEQMRWLGIDTEVIIVGKSENIFDAVRAIKAGANNYIVEYDLSALLESISEIMEKKKERLNNLAQRMDLFVKTNASDSLIDLNMLSDHFNVSISYISKLFSEQIGVTFRKRVRFYRVQAAKNMLEQSSKSLYAVSKLSGFFNQKRLSETFVQFEGIPPLKYRQLYQEYRNSR